MVAIDVELWYGKMCLVDTVRTIHNKLLGSECLDMLSNLLGPGHRDIFVAKLDASQFVASLVGEDGWIFGVRQAGILIAMGQEVANVVFEIVDDSSVGVELHDKR